jgi:ribosomal protein S1
VTVLEVDIARKRIALSMKDETSGTLKPKKEKTSSVEKEPATIKDALSALKKKFGK